MQLWKEDAIVEKSNKIISMNKCFNIAKSEYVKWICNPKVSLLLIMMIFVYDLVTSKMLDAADKLNVSLNMFEPFIAICNSSVLLLIMPSVFIGLMGDFPRVDGNSMFYLQRTGKQNWLIGQFIFSFMAATTYTTIVFIGSCISIIGRCSLKNDWSSVTTKYISYFPDESESMVAKFIDGRLYNNLRPLKACIFTFTLMILFLVLISMLLMLGFCIGKHGIGIVITAVIICIGSICVQFESGVRWLFPTSHIALWLHYDSIYKEQIFNLRISYICLMLVIIGLCFMNSILIERYDFSKVSDMED